MTAAVFRVTRIDLDENEHVSAVHAVADDATADLVRVLAGGASLDIRAGAWDGGVLGTITMPVAAFKIVLDASGKIPGDDPRYREGLNDSLFRVWNGLISEEW
jgi:hypothetical protein